MFGALLGRKRIDGPSPAEIKVAKLRRKGLKAEEIASEISRSVSTVKCHDKSIIAKMGARNITQAIADMLERGYLH